MARVAFIIIIFFIYGCATQQESNIPDWHMIYHHDNNGQALAGSKENLIALINEGRPVRIYWPIKDRLEHFSNADFITILNNEVFAQTQSVIKQIPDREQTRIALDASEQSKWHAIFSTTGELRSFQSKEPSLRDYRFELKWFVFSN